jgi:hypothetical protein
MAPWRSLVSVLVALSVTATVRAQTYPLTEAPLAGAAFRVQLNLSLTGEIRISREGKSVALKQTVTAGHDLLERVLASGGDGVKVARYYKAAKAALSVGDNHSERGLRSERSLLVTQRYKDQPLAYCPAGPLTREELELTDHFDTLSLAGLLPGKAVAVGETWKVANATAQALCHLDGLTSHELVGKLEQVKDQVAHVTITGPVAGIDLGASVTMTIRAAGQFDLKAGRLTALEWKQTEERDQGPASPAATVTATTTLTRAAIEVPSELCDVALAGVPDGWVPPEDMAALAYHDPQGRYDLLSARDWQLVGRTDEHLVMRLLDRGEFVAQVTVTPWRKMEKGSHVSKEEFKATMAQTPNWTEAEELEAKDMSKEIEADKKNYWVYRISALGQLDNLNVMQYFYLVAGPEGDQVVLAFTMTPAQAQKLAARDLALVRTLTFPAAAKEDSKK